MKCKACKHQIDDDSIYCKFCGEKQIKERKKKAEIKVPAPKQLPSGTWFSRVTVGSERVSVSAPSEAEYYAKARAIKAGLIAAVKRKPEPTLRDLLLRYVENNSDVLSPATLRGYNIIIRNRFKGYIDMPADKIDYQAMINEDAKRLAPKTVSNSWGLVHPALLAAKLPVPEVNLPAVPAYDGDWLDYEQIKLFLDAVRGDKVELTALLALNSLRLSEALALDAGSFRDGYIVVKGAVVLDANNKLTRKNTNKNRTSTRTIPIVIPRLSELIPESGKAVAISTTTITRRLKAVCEKAELPVCTMHDLRRSFASLAYHLGWSEMTTMQVGGWSNMETVRKVYQKLAAKDKNEDIIRMQGFYSTGDEHDNSTI